MGLILLLRQINVKVEAPLSNTIGVSPPIFLKKSNNLSKYQTCILILLRFNYF